ncbi:MAG: TetR/AcrR family transcriptional regulator [Planctomycetes bacterium]|nr:TetR/AcrR family transcriptional regulator [Planctomycetota bacterium]
MPRANRSQNRRAELLPDIARAFAELGYRRTTTAALAARCATKEMVLYRLWPDKKSMFLAAIEHVYDVSVAAWERLLAAADGRSAAERLLAYEATHHGEFGLYRLVFAGLSETDDVEIRAALARMYQRYHEFIVRRLVEHRGPRQRSTTDLVAWALIGMGTVSSIGRELDLLPPRQRQRLWATVGRRLLGPRRR